VSFGFRVNPPFLTFIFPSLTPSKVSPQEAKMSMINVINSINLARKNGGGGGESVLEAPTEAAKAASAFVRINTSTGGTAFKVF
jgi:hypothetical protein